MPQKPKILSRRQVVQSRIFRVEEMEIEYANGERRTHERLLGGSSGSVLIVPMLDEDTVLLIREYASGTDNYQLGLPKGRIEAGETPLAAAGREIREETGYAARNLELLRTVTIVPSYIQHNTHVILARDLYPDRLEGDEPEPIEVVPWRLSNWQQLLAQPDFTEARSIAALCLTREYLQ
ncbi:ADP-ribose diphosphatase [Candidatus Endoriftia persephone str. Guaymas]|jgi:ADP-ribose diphosphatase|uniref:ADP compounds hydrolase NudE n=4 Tax=Gammaproteobacteria TaxID=1236 RepID=G2FG34_9GAMM|nr:ADP compounds hydrolase NudE [Candidatus Endoriftia persephone]MBA1332774.1 ADP-ribose diphosphatase [Candidatus Endoriftia persephone str. Guaymas]EGW54267.1 ADP compounds hydrolase NudE [endosymbiont of Tevnia jerichonana (vent Tica)]KRT53798.1 NUDIX domain [endosymbiont of Ridgeia piscesae]KRT60007.1 ADP-ribose diphosphatase [endosymbiont of Ridgeia piscesae]USF87434.1 ADP compounds hydrolase NudE [Candidatus Endoriftia persephone]